MSQNYVMMGLGSYRFSLATAAYSQFKRQSEWDWPEQGRVGKVPIIQYLGGGKETITLDGLILPEFKGGTGQVEQMRLQGDRGEPLALISGQGIFFGLYVITSIDERQGPEFWPDGTFRRQSFTITLKLYNQFTVNVGGYEVSPFGLLAAVL